MELTVNEDALVLAKVPSPITKMVEHDDCVVWMVDLSAKRAEVLYTSLLLDGQTDYDIHTVVVGRGEETLRWFGPDATFSFETPSNQFWIVTTDISRYTLNIAAFRVDKD